MEGSGCFREKDFMACCSSARFSEEMAAAAPFSGVQEAIAAARDIWFNKVDVAGWLEAFVAHPQIGSRSPLVGHKNDTSAQWSKEEQSTALATATDYTSLELFDWNAQYRQKFGFVFLICASGRSTPEILSELKKRYLNRPIVEFEIAANEQMKITEIRLANLFESKEKVKIVRSPHPELIATKAEEIFENRSLISSQGLVWWLHAPPKVWFGGCALLPNFSLHSIYEYPYAVRQTEHKKIV